MYVKLQGQLSERKMFSKSNNHMHAVFSSDKFSYITAGPLKSAENFFFHKTPPWYILLPLSGVH